MSLIPYTIQVHKEHIVNKHKRNLHLQLTSNDRFGIKFISEIITFVSLTLGLTILNKISFDTLLELLANQTSF